MEYNSFNKDVVEDTVRLGWVDVKVDPLFKERVLNSLINDYSVRPKARVNWKMSLGFGLAWVAVLALLVYGFWLPTSINFLSLG